MGIGTRSFTNVEGLAKKVATTGALPTSANDGDLAVVLDVDDLYEYDGDTSSWVKIGSVSWGGGGGSANFLVETRSITGTEISNKQLTLVNTPTASSAVIVDAIGGTGQRVSVDFSLTGNILSWNGLGLDGVVSSGDVLRISYTY